MEEDQFLEVAYQIGRKLCRDAIWSGNKCNWVGPSMEYISAGWAVVQRAYGTDLYNGTTGIGFFLSHLYAKTKDEIVRKTALGCFEQAVVNAEQIYPSARIGFYTGWAGIIAVLRTCSPLLQTDAFDQRVAGMLDTIYDFDLSNGGIDILAGCAGAIPLLLSQPMRGEEMGVRTAKRIADHLIGKAHRAEKGWSWNTLDHDPGTPARPGAPARNLTGFSHGTAGIAWAFLELFDLTAEVKYHQAARNAFEYERGWFNPVYGNWPDLRSFDGQKLSEATMYASVAWCHGAPGIGLSRIRAYDLLNDEVCRREAETAIATTCDMLTRSLDGNATNFSLCHGLGGNAELLLMGAMSLGKDDLFSLACRIGHAGIDEYGRSESWTCGIVGAGEMPGLMLGLAGIGYFYLRLSDPVHTPSILLPIPASLS